MSQFTLQGIVSDLHADLIDTSTWGGAYDGVAGNRSITFATRGGYERTFPIPHDMPSPPLGAKVTITFEVQS